MLLNKSGQEIERILLMEKSQVECRQLLLDKGFYMKKSIDEDVPEEFQDAPYNSPHAEL